MLFYHRTQNPYSLENSRDKNPLVFFEALYALRTRLIKNGTFDNVERSFVNWSLDFCFWHLQTLGEKGHCILFKALKRELYQLGIASKPRDFFIHPANHNKLHYILSIPLWLHKLNRTKPFDTRGIFWIHLRGKKTIIRIFGFTLYKRNCDEDYLV